MNWIWSLTPEATSYYVYEAGSIIATLEGSTTYWWENLGSDTTNWTETGLSSNTVYTRYVRAANADGVGIVSVDISSHTMAYAPTTLTASATNAVDIMLNWNYSGATSYYIIFTTHAPQSAKSSWTMGGAPLGTYTNAMLSNVIKGATYWISLAPRNGDGVASYAYDFPLASTRTVPNQVDFFTRSSATATSITWAWTPATGADGYIVYTATDDTALQTLGYGTTTWTEGSLAVCTPYGRYVKPINNMGLGVASPSATYYTLTNPPTYYAITTNDMSSAGIFSFKFSRNGNPTGQIVSYDIELSTVSFGDIVRLSSTNASGYVVTCGTVSLNGLSPNTTCFIRGRSKNPDSLYSDWLNIVSTVTISGTPTSMPPITSTGTFVARWNKQSQESDLTEYYCELSLQTPGNWVTVQNSGWIVNKTSYSFEGLLANATYYSRVNTRNVLGRTLVNPVYISSGPTSCNMPSPVSVTANPLGKEVSFFVGSNGNMSDTYMEVSYSTDNFTTSFSTRTPNVLGDSSSGLWEGLSFGTTYWVRFRTLAKNGNHSDFTTVISTYLPNVVYWTGGVNTDVGVQDNWLPNPTGFYGDADLTGLTVVLGGSRNCLWNVSNSTFTAINLAPGYTGTLDVQNDLYLAGNFTVADGTFTLTGGTVTIKGDIANTASGKWDTRGGKVVMNSASTANLGVLPSAMFGNLDINSAGHLTLTSTITVAGNLNETGVGDIKMGDNTLYAKGNVSISGTLNDTNKGTLYMYGNTAQNLLCSGTMNKLVVNCSSAVIQANNIDMYSFELQGGEYVPGENMTVYTAATISGGTFNCPNNTMNLATGPGVITVNQPLRNLKVSNGNWQLMSNTALLGNLTIDGGSLALENYRHAVAGQTNINAGTLFVQESTTTFGGQLTLATGAGMSMASGSLQLAGSSVTLNGNFIAVNTYSSITSTSPGTTYFGIEANGIFQVSGLTLNGVNTKGLVLGQGISPAGNTIANIVFANSEPGAIGIQYNKNSGAYNFNNFTFDNNISINIATPNITWANGTGYINMNGATGPKAGFVNEWDPNCVVFWQAAGQPTVYQSEALSSSSMRWHWTPGEDAVLYRVYLATSMAASISGDLVTTLAAPATSWAMTGLTPNTTCQAYVVAYNNLGVSTSTISPMMYTNAAQPNTIQYEVTSSSINVQWSNNSNPGTVGYVVKYSSIPNDSATPQYTSTSVVTNAWLTQLQPYTTYYISVKAVNSLGLSTAYTTETGVRTLIVGPATPAGLYGTALSTTSIRWTWNLANSATYYDVFSSTGGDRYVRLDESMYEQASGTATWVETGLANNFNYTRYVVAGNVTGTSSASGTASKYTLGLPPSAVGVVVVDSTSISISWNANAATINRIERSADNSTYVFVSSVAANALAYTNTGLGADTTYWFRIMAINANMVLNDSQYSMVVTTITLPAAPGGLSATVVSSNSITWSWNTGSANVTGYHVYSSTAAEIIRILPKETNTWTETGLEANIPYTRIVLNYNKAGDGPSSDITKFTYAIPPESVNIVSVGYDTVVTSWPDSELYQARVERSTDNSAWVFVSSSTDGSYGHTALSGDTTYWFRVGAINGDKIQTPAQYSAVSSTITLPAPPTGFSGSACTTGSIMWTWSTGTVTNVLGYKIYTSSDSSLLATLTKNTSFWLEESLAANTQYTRVVKKFNNAGLGGGASTSKYTLANAPTVLLSGTTTQHTIAISWTGNGGSKYRVDRSTNGVDTWTTLIAAADNLTSASYVAQGLQLGTKYYFQVYGYNGDEIITSSTTGNGTTDSLPATVTLIVTTATVTQEHKATPEAGEVKIEIPAGAISTDGYIQINVNAGTAPTEVTKAELDDAITVLSQAESKVVSGSVIEINLFTLTGSTVTTTFTKKLTLTMTYPDANGDDLVDGITPPIRPEALRIFTLNKTTKKWELVSGTQTLDKTAKKISVEIEHFSMYAIVSVPTSQNDLSKAVVYPNPYKPGSGGAFDNTSFGEGVVFDKLTAKANIKIFNIAGELVAEVNETDGDGKYVWNIKNDDGSKVASGVYIYLITNPENGAHKTKGKFAIIK